MSADKQWPGDWDELQGRARVRLLRDRARRQAVGARGERRSGFMLAVASVQRVIPALVVVGVIALVGLALRDRWLSGGQRGVLSGVFEPPAGQSVLGSSSRMGGLEATPVVVPVVTPEVVESAPVVGATLAGFPLVATGMPFQRPP